MTAPSLHVLGLDLALAHAGAAQLHRDGRVYTHRYATDPLPCVEGHQPCPDHHPAPIPATALRIREVARWAVGRATTGTVLVVIEELPRGTTMGQHDERAALVWTVIGQFVQHQIPVALVNPMTLKARIAGHGRADKDRMRTAVAALYPGHGLHQVSWDEADAVALATLGVIKLAAVHGRSGPWQGPWLDARATAIGLGAQWPDLTGVGA